MKAKTIQSLSETWQPEPVEIPARMTLVKEGTSLPNSVAEDIGGFSLMPIYSRKQLRRMHRLGLEKSQFGSITKSAKKGWRRVERW